VKGKHTITVGTHNELFKFYNLFIQNLYGNYEFSSLARSSSPRTWVYYPNFNSPTLIGYSGLTNGKETFNLSTITSQTFQGTFTRDDLKSRWQMQWGLRVRF
jgi:hypothetical protein